MLNNYYDSTSNVSIIQKYATLINGVQRFLIFMRVQNVVNVIQLKFILNSCCV